MTNRPDLIAQLEKLTPTEGEWVLDGEYMISGSAYLCDFDNSDSTQDDIDLITLAPQMRLAILEMAKEIGRLQMKLGLDTIELKSCRDKL